MVNTLATPAEFRQLFPEFESPSWSRWNALSDILAGEVPESLDCLRLSGHTALPQTRVRELWCIKGRGSGGSRFCALEATYAACACRWPHAPGETIFVGVFGPDKKQSKVTLDYIRGFIQSVPELAALVVSETQESITLETGVTLEVITANASAPRARSYAVGIVEEAGFLPPDGPESGAELVRALRPALARVPGSRLLVVGSPYTPDTVLFDATTLPHDDAVIILQADTLSMNATFDPVEVERAFRDDPVSAWSEYGRAGEIRFRSDVVGYLLDRTVLSAVVPTGVRMVPPGGLGEPVAHFDAATGSDTPGADRCALAIARTGDPVELVLTRAWDPPFSPTQVASEVASLCRTYGIQGITIDRYAPNLVRDLFRPHDLQCWAAEMDTSTAFLSLLTLLNSGTCRLLDDALLLRELGTLERKPLPSGRDRIGHRPNAHDDQAAAVAFALTQAASLSTQPQCGLCSDPSCRGFHFYDGRDREQEPGQPSVIEQQIMRAGWWAPGRQ